MTLSFSTFCELEFLNNDASTWSPWFHPFSISQEVHSLCYFLSHPLQTFHLLEANKAQCLKKIHPWFHILLWLNMSKAAYLFFSFSKFIFALRSPPQWRALSFTHLLHTEAGPMLHATSKLCLISMHSSAPLLPPASCSPTHCQLLSGQLQLSFSSCRSPSHFPDSS